MTAAIDNATKQCLDAFQRFDVDTKLALLWYGYLDIKDQLTPVNEPNQQDAAEVLFHQIQAFPKEEQLQAQRDIVNGADTPTARAFAAFGPSARIDVWLRLAQGMEDGRIIPMPSNYQLPAETKDFSNQIKQLSFEQRLGFMRELVKQMGTRQGATV